MAEIKDDQFDEGPTNGETVVYTTSEYKPTRFLNFLVYLFLGSVAAIFVTCTIWLCAWILQGLPGAR